MRLKEVIEGIVAITFMAALLVMLGMALWMTAIVQGNV